MTASIQTRTWEGTIKEEKQKDYFKKIKQFLADEVAAKKVIYPRKEDIFNAFKLTPFEDVKVVVIGQDPYHGPNQAHGLSFSVRKGIQTPPSLRNIYKELHDDIGFLIPDHGCLEPWATQGVLLLNATLTVQAHQPQSHSKIGWQQFTDNIIRCLNQHPQQIIYLLWGAYAQSKSQLIDTAHHIILKAPHPSPLSAHRGFFGCKHFSKTNSILIQNGRGAIDWSL